MHVYITKKTVLTGRFNYNTKTNNCSGYTEIMTIFNTNIAQILALQVVIICGVFT